MNYYPTTKRVKDILNLEVRIAMLHNICDHLPINSEWVETMHTAQTLTDVLVERINALSWDEIKQYQYIHGHEDIRNIDGDLYAKFEVEQDEWLNEETA